MQETVESGPAAAQNRQAAARARYGSVVQRHVARQQLLASWARCSGAFAARWMVGCTGGSQVAGGSLQLWIVYYLGSLQRVLAPPPPVMGRRRWCGFGVARSTSLASAFLPCYSPAVPLVVTCAQGREEVLEADLIGDEEEGALRDHLLAAHPNTVQPATLSGVLHHFVVTEEPPHNHVSQ